MTVVPVALTAMDTGAGVIGAGPTAGAGASMPVQGMKSGSSSIRRVRARGSDIQSIWAFVPGLSLLSLLLLSLL
jgi:hypothetical protein